MATDTVVPKLLRDRVASDIRPVSPLWPPWRRALVFLALGLLLLASMPVWRGVRKDAGELGGVLLWGLSLLQAFYGVLLVAAGLRFAVPGRGPRGRWGYALVAAGVLLSLGVTSLSWAASHSLVPPGHEGHYWRVCFKWTIWLGLPALVLAWLLAVRAFPLRPRLVGALSGLGAGLIADAGWRTFCEVSDPAHVLSAHAGGVAALTVLGVVIAHVWAAATGEG